MVKNHFNLLLVRSKPLLVWARYVYHKPAPNQVRSFHTAVDSVFDIDSILLFVLCFWSHGHSSLTYIFMVKLDKKVIYFSNDPAMALSVT